MVEIKLINLIEILCRPHLSIVGISI